MKKKLKKIKKTVIKGVVTVVTVTETILLCSIPTFAAGTSASGDSTGVTGKINLLTSLFAAIVSAIGLFHLVKDVMELSTAWKQQDGPTMNQAIKGAVGSFLMFSVSGVLSFLGFNA